MSQSIQYAPRFINVFNTRLFPLATGLTAPQTGDTVKVTVNAPEYVEGTFNASIDVDSITDFNSGHFDLSFDSSVVNVTDVADGSLDGEII